MQAPGASLKVGQSNMDTLVALGSTTAFGYSTPGHYSPAWVAISISWKPPPSFRSSVLSTIGLKLASVNAPVAR